MEVAVAVKFLCLLPKYTASHLMEPSNLKMKATDCSEKILTYYETTRRHSLVTFATQGTKGISLIPCSSFLLLLLFHIISLYHLLRFFLSIYIMLCLHLFFLLCFSFLDRILICPQFRNPHSFVFEVLRDTYNKFRQNPSSGC